MFRRDLAGSTGFGKSNLFFVDPSEARDLSWSYKHEKKERFLAPFGMTKSFETFSAA